MKITKKSLYITVIILFLSILAPITVSNHSGTVDAKTKGGTVTFGLTGDIVALDPAFAYDFTTNPVVNQITEGLLKFDKNGKLKPNLAEKWENPDPKTYIYHIRKGVKFQDGTPMTVDDVIFSMDRIKDPKTGSYLAWMYNNVSSISKINDSTIKVILKQPDIQWRYAPATSACHVISKAYFQKNQKKFGKPDGGLLGTGPYKYVSWKTGSEVVLKKSRNYWDKSGGPYVDKLVFKVIPDGTTRVTGLKNGSIDMTIGLPLDLIPLVEKMKDVKVQTSDSFMVDWVAFNTQKKPFSDPNVRKAICYALDKGKILKDIVKKSGSAARTVPVGSKMWVFAKGKWKAFYDKIPDYKYNLKKAKKFLAKSAYPKGFKAEIVTDANTLRLNVALTLQEAVKPLGIDLKVKKVSEQELTTIQFGKARDYDILTGNWGSDFPDPTGNIAPLFLSLNTGDGGSNFSNYKNKEVDSLLNEELRLTDDNKRTDLMIKALKIIADDVPFFVVDHPKQFLAESSKLKGYDVTPLWYWDSFAKNLRYK